MKLKVKYNFKTIEDIAIQYLEDTEPQKIPNIETNKTIVDPRFILRKHSFKKNILQNNNNYDKSPHRIKQHTINFFKIPQKFLSEEEDFPLTEEDTLSKINSQKSLTNIVSTVKLREVKPLIIKKNSKFPLNYQNIYECINQIYNPLLQNLETVSSLKSNTDIILSKIDYCVTHNSIFELFNFELNDNTNNLYEFFEEIKIYENIEFSLILFILHIIMEVKIDYLDNICEDDILIIYQNCYLTLQKLYETIILFLLNNEYINDKNNHNISFGGEINNKNIGNSSNEQLCSNFVSDYYKFILRPINSEQIINKINENAFVMIKLLTDSINVLISNLTVFKHETGNLINPDEEELLFLTGYMNEILKNINTTKEKVTLSKEFEDQYIIFKTMFLFCTNNKENSYKFYTENINNNTENNNNTNSTSILKKFTDIFTSYKELHSCFLLYYSNFKLLLEKNKVKPPFLPPLNTSKYKYTLVVDLDETLVHYIEEENKAYVQVRPYADYFLSEMGKLFEIVIFTAAAEDYADLVLDELDKNKDISYKLYRKHTEQLDGAFIKDLSKLGRDLKKVCIIDNNKDNFRLQPENGLHICSFIGDQNDDELFSLCTDLQKIISANVDDIRPIIKEISENMKKRYAEKDVILE